MKPIDIKEVEMAIKGNKDVFSKLILERKKDIYRLVYGYIKCNDEILDIIGEATYKAFISVNKLRNAEYFNTWLTKIVINCCIDFLKKKNLYIESEKYYEEIDKYTLDSDHYEDILSEIDIMKHINKLSPTEKTIIMLKYYEDFTLNQIAEIIKCPIGTVKTKLHRSLKTLRKEIENNI